MVVSISDIESSAFEYSQVTQNCMDNFGSNDVDVSEDDEENLNNAKDTQREANDERLKNEALKVAANARLKRTETRNRYDKYLRDYIKFCDEKNYSCDKQGSMLAFFDDLRNGPRKLKETSFPGIFSALKNRLPAHLKRDDLNFSDWKLVHDSIQAFAANPRSPVRKAAIFTEDDYQQLYDLEEQNNRDGLYLLQMKAFILIQTLACGRGMEIINIEFSDISYGEGGDIHIWLDKEKSDLESLVVIANDFEAAINPAAIVQRYLQKIPVSVRSGRIWKQLNNKAFYNQHLGKNQRFRAAPYMAEQLGLGTVREFRNRVQKFGSHSFKRSAITNAVEKGELTDDQIRQAAGWSTGTNLNREYHENSTKNKANISRKMTMGIFGSRNAPVAAAAQPADNISSLVNLMTVKMLADMNGTSSAKTRVESDDESEETIELKRKIRKLKKKKELKKKLKELEDLEDE